MNVRSSLYAAATDGDIRTVLKATLDTAPIDYHLLSGGLFNTTYFIKTSDRGDVILRLGPVNRHLLLHPYDDRGVDVVGEPTEDIRFLYEDCRNWLLDYDIERMRNIFEQSKKP